MEALPGNKQFLCHRI